MFGAAPGPHWFTDPLIHRLRNRSAPKCCAADTSSARDCTAIFSISRWRWAFGPLCRSKLISDLLVRLTSHHKFKDLPFARRQLGKPTAEYIELGFDLA